ncbi:alkyl sulfatase dimerization domain-containing protein [Oceanisphaera pacifica]|uniref:MBL fold metallo-hydrolase n=1 Tax=Oceanisphaera pacifica TaxID=2818389 RepID=A0ABS3NFQ9_9GAMM|nr:alkyl sulfatase dimerization domain-containing protein [Oceanisphaera pacifica]MBO1519409.1 MBL fold metallo-hydrolase [Oceanisphaera pacifica]
MTSFANEPEQSKFDSSLLKPELLNQNSPREVESFESPDFLKHLAPIRKTFGNLAYTESSEKVNPRMTAFAKHMEKTMYEPVKDRVFLMSGWQLTATLIVVGDDGLIVIDPGENDDAASALMKAFRDETGNTTPVKGVIYTHRHIDHPFGVAGVGVTQDMVDNEEVRIFAHHEFMDYLANDASVVSDILTQRSAYAAASYLGVGEDGFVHGGLGPAFTFGTQSLYRPTELVTDKLEVEVAGVNMVIFEAYGDAEDEISVFFPDFNHLNGAETIQGESFPNIYSLRGTKFRDPVKWYKGIDRLLESAQKADSYSHSHGRAWLGNDFIVERIQNYRDAIQYVHDQTIRHMNKGAIREELVDLVELPPQLADDPWLQEFYGSVEHSVRNIYVDYMGWFQGDATELATPSFHRKAKLYVEAMGGASSVMTIANQAVEAQDYGWAAEVLTHLVRAEPENQTAKDLKAHALREWGYDQSNPYFRQFALSGAAELDNTKKDLPPVDFGSPAIVSQLSIGTLLENLRVKIDADKAVNADFKIGFNITDRDEQYGFHIRNGIAAFYEYVPDDAQVTLNIPSQVIYDYVLGKKGIKQSISDGSGTIEGGIDKLDEFGSYFDFSKTDINISSR